MFNLIKKLNKEKAELQRKFIDAQTESCRLAEMMFDVQRENRYFRAHDQNAQDALKEVRRKNSELVQKIEFVCKDNDRLISLLESHGIDPNEELPEEPATPPAAEDEDDDGPDVEF